MTFRALARFIINCLGSVDSKLYLRLAALRLQLANALFLSACQTALKC